MTISNYTNSELINELVARGVLKADFADKEAKRVARAAAKAERDQALSIPPSPAFLQSSLMLS